MTHLARVVACVLLLLGFGLIFGLLGPAIDLTRLGSWMPNLLAVGAALLALYVIKTRPRRNIDLDD